MDAAYYLLPNPGCLHLGGDDRLGYLQRQTTNDVRLLEPGQAVLTVLTTPAARILDVLTLLNEPDAIRALTLPGFAEKTARFLKSRIFFMDKVSLEDQSAAFSQVELLGEEAAALIGLPEKPAVGAAAPLNAIHPAARAIFQHPAFGAGWRILLPVEALPALQALFLQAGAPQLDPASYQLLRLESGLASAGSEWNEQYTPYETGLQAAVSTGKGCYTGQEVLARQVTYDKITQTLVGLRLSEEAQPGMRLWDGDRVAGVITSAGCSPRFGAIALGVVKRPLNEPGSRLAFGAEQPEAGLAEVTALPFS
jgi:folate-binding protein YgfZ